MAEEKKEDTSVKITNQFWRRESMVYDLSCAGVRITIAMAPRPNSDGMGEWGAEVHARQAPEPPIVGEPGATKGDALRAVARVWTSKAGAFGYPPLDWEAIAKALQAVRAI